MSYYALPSLNVSFSRLITSVVHERTVFFLPSITLTFVVSIRRTSSSSGCLGNAALFYCDTPFHITI